jgi:hypothetical protein
MALRHNEHTFPTCALKLLARQSSYMDRAQNQTIKQRRDSRGHAHLLVLHACFMSSTKPSEPLLPLLQNAAH